MSSAPAQAVHVLVPSALAAASAGTWEYDIARDRFCCDPSTASLFGLAEFEGERGVPLQRIGSMVHPDDRAGFQQRHDHLVKNGGLFVVEYRTFPTLGDMRWVLTRGCYDRDARGRVLFGRGLMLDVTELKMDGFADGRASFVEKDGQADPAQALDVVAERALALRRAIDHLGGSGLFLRSFIDGILINVGRRIAGRR